jgi:hypothetical protein
MNKIKAKAKANERKKANNESLSKSLNHARGCVAKISIRDRGSANNHLLWNGSGVLVRLCREDVPNVGSAPICFLSSRAIFPNPFTATHAHLKFYDGITGKHNHSAAGDTTGSGVFYYTPPTEIKQLIELQSRTFAKLSHVDKQLFEKLEVQDGENNELDFSLQFVPEESRPTNIEPLDLTEFSQQWLHDSDSDYSDCEFDKDFDEDDSDEERDEFACNEEKEKEESKGGETKTTTTTKITTTTTNGNDTLSSLPSMSAMKRNSSSPVMMKRKISRRLSKRNSLLSLLSNETDQYEEAAKKRHVERLRTRNRKLRESAPPSIPSVSVGDELLILQYRDIQNNALPEKLECKVFHITTNGTIYYRVDPRHDTDKFMSGAILLKKFVAAGPATYMETTAESSATMMMLDSYKIVGMHITRADSVPSVRPEIEWCHRGILVQSVLSNLRKHVVELKNKSKEIEEASGEVFVNNKIAREIAKREVHNLMEANSDLERKVIVVSMGKIINEEKAFDLTESAEVEGIHVVLLLMSCFTSNFFVQGFCLRSIARLLLGTVVRKGDVVKQTERFVEYGKLGVLEIVLKLLKSFSKQDYLIRNGVWVLALLSQNVVNARKWGDIGGNNTLRNILMNYSVFGGQGNAVGQKWAASALENLVKVSANRKELCGDDEDDDELLNLYSALVKLVDNSESVKRDSKCVCAVLGAITELARYPNHATTRVRLCDFNAHIRVQDIVEFYNNRGEVGNSTKIEFTEQELKSVNNAGRLCLETLSYEVPSATWKKALEDEFYKIDWNKIHREEGESNGNERATDNDNSETAFDEEKDDLDEDEEEEEEKKRETKSEED